MKKIKTLDDLIKTTEGLKENISDLNAKISTIKKDLKNLKNESITNFYIHLGEKFFFSYEFLNKKDFKEIAKILSEKLTLKIKAAQTDLEEFTRELEHLEKMAMSNF